MGSFAEVTAKATGKSKTAVKRPATRGKKIVVLQEIAEEEARDGQLDTPRAPPMRPDPIVAIGMGGGRIRIGR